MSEKFWFQHPNELIKDFDFWPREGMRFEEKLNAISRLVIILSCLGYIYTKNTQIFVVGLTTLGVIIFLYQQKKTIHETEKSRPEIVNQEHLRGKSNRGQKKSTQENCRDDYPTKRRMEGAPLAIHCSRPFTSLDG